MAENLQTTARIISDYDEVHSGADEGQIETEKEENKEKISLFSSKPIIKIFFNSILTNKFGSRWKLDQSELNLLTKATDDLLIKYSINFGKYSEEINFISVLGMILLSRIELGEKDEDTIYPQKRKQNNSNTRKKGSR